MKQWSRYLLPCLGTLVLAVGVVRSSSASASAMSDDVALDVAREADAEGCRAVASGDGREVLCAKGGRTVIGLREQPQDVACPNGGRAVSWGSDVNGSGLLEPSELEGSTYVCAHAPASSGKNALVRRTPLALRDGHCPAGGTLVQSGVDRDGDGVLAPAEVARATFACNRFGGPALEALVEVGEVAPGPTCANGGKRIRVGHEGETGRISFVCNAR